MMMIMMTKGSRKYTKEKEGPNRIEDLRIHLPEEKGGKITDMFNCI